MDRLANMWYGLAAINLANVLIQTGNLFSIAPLVGLGVVGMFFAVAYWGWSIHIQRSENKRKENQQNNEFLTIQRNYESNTLDQMRVLNEQFRAIQERERLEIERMRQEAEAIKAAEDKRVISEAVAITKKKAKKGKIDLSKGPSIDISKHPLDRSMDLS